MHITEANDEPMNTILVPTDFSNNANNALEYAAEIAAISKARMVLLNVYTPIVSRGNVVSALITDEIGDARRDANEKLEIIQTTLKKEYEQINCETQVRVGEAVEEILKASLELKADLIVMGTLGASNLTRTLFGSNTASVVERSMCPVLCIPSTCAFKKPEKILFATNFSYHDIQGVVRLTRLAAAFGSEIVLGHVDTSIHEEDEPVVKSMEKFLLEAERASQYAKISQKIVNDHNVSMGLESIIQQGAVDMVALSTHKRNFFEKFYNPSLTKKLAMYTSIPLVVFQNPPDDEKTGRDF